MFIGASNRRPADRTRVNLLEIFAFQIFNDSGYEWVPVIHATMQNRNTASYDVVFAAVLRRWKSMGIAVAVKTVQTDFEEAMMKSVANNFGQEAVKGCLFHYCQAVIRNVRKCGLMSAYNEKGIVNQWIRRLLALPLLPQG